MDGFVACHVTGAADVERAARQQLAASRERPVSPFDSGSYTDILKLAATNLDAEGSYRELLADGAATPEAGEHLVVTDIWALFSRPRKYNFWLTT
jgi:hypothetical protein